MVKACIRKIIISSSIFMLGAVMLGGCSMFGKTDGEQSSSGDEAGTIKQLEVYTTSQNEEHIYHVNYPYSYYYFQTMPEGNVQSSMADLEDAVRDEEVPEEEYDYLINYLTNLPQREGSEESALAYKVYLRYVDKNGKEQSMALIGYDEFPEGWEEFITRYNGICGGEYLEENGEIQQVTPAFLTEVFGVTDDDVKDGTLQDVIETQKLDMTKVTGLFNMERTLDAHYAYTQGDLLDPYRPGELMEIECTDEEYDAFVAEYLECLGDDWEETESDQKDLRLLYNGTEKIRLYVGKTEDIQNMSVCLTSFSATGDSYYTIDLDAHMEGMSYSAEFIYSADGKFMLVYTEENPDVLLPFVGE